MTPFNLHAEIAHSSILVGKGNKYGGSFHSSTKQKFREPKSNLGVQSMVSDGNSVNFEF